MSDTYTPQPGDIGVTKIDGDVGEWIELGQILNGLLSKEQAGTSLRQRIADAKREHAFVVVAELGGYPPHVLGLIEAEPGGARCSLLSEYEDRDVVYLRCPDEHRNSVEDAAIGLMGTPYSFADYASLAAHRLRIPAPHLRAYIRDSGHMICSQLADRAAMLGGWHIFSDGRWEGDVVPADLARLAREQEAERARTGTP